MWGKHHNTSTIGLAAKAFSIFSATKKNRMKIAVSGQRVGDFASYHPLFMVWSRSPFICICHLMSAGSGHSVYGRLLNLSEEVRRSGHTCLYLFFNDMNIIFH